MERKMDVIDDFNGRKIVFIHDIIFKKKQYVVCKLVPFFMPWKHGYGSLLSTYLVINKCKSDILDK